MSLIQDVRRTIAGFLERCHVPYEVASFDDVLYQECVDEAIRRGYSIDVWAALYVACVLFVDDVMTRFPLERTNVYLFNRWFVRGQAHDDVVLETLTDLLHQVHDLFQPASSNLIVTSTLDFVTANLLEHETKGITVQTPMNSIPDDDMEISSAIQQYAAYQRMMAAALEAFVFMAFPCEIPVKDYIQALPEMMLFFNNTDDILSSYKEELAGETTNQISIVAARNKTPKLDALNALAETTADIFERAVEMLDDSPEACETFKKFATGLVRFHTSVGRYRLADLGLQ